MRSIIKDIKDYCYGNRWYLFIPITVFIIVDVFLSIISKDHVSILFYGTIFLARLGGYFLFSFAGNLLSSIAGIFFELLLPLIFLRYFIKQKLYLGIVFCIYFLAMVLLDLSINMADAKYLQLDVINIIGVKIEMHDWNIIFSTLGILDKSELIANIVKYISYILAVLSLSLSIWMTYLSIYSSIVISRLKKNQLLSKT